MIKNNLTPIDCFIFVANTDALFIKHTLPALLNKINNDLIHITIVVDAKTVTGVLGSTLRGFNLTDISAYLSELQREFDFDLIFYKPTLTEISDLSKLQFGKIYSETHCFRGYPLTTSINQFTKSDNPYILHFDCDMIFYEVAEYSWIQEGIRIMEENEDILCVLPRGGPPTQDGSLHQGTTEYEVDNKRGLHLFKNFTSRHYLIHRERFMSLLPLKPQWLSWREPIKSRLIGNGKMLCWEAMVEQALEKSSMWRADLMTDRAWSLHPGDRSEQFYELLPQIIDSVNRNEFPEEQRGHFDLRLNDWKHFLH